jgi:hypothetical protein
MKEVSREGNKSIEGVNEVNTSRESIERCGVNRVNESERNNKVNRESINSIENRSQYKVNLQESIESRQEFNRRESIEVWKSIQNHTKSINPIQNS